MNLRFAYLESGQEEGNSFKSAAMADIHPAVLLTNLNCRILRTPELRRRNVNLISLAIWVD